MLAADAADAETTSRTTKLHWADVEAADGLNVLTALLLDAHLLVSFTEDGGKQYGLHADDGSAATEQNGHVEESGPCRLWEELEQIAREWTRLGRPSRSEFELSIRLASGVADPAVVLPDAGWTAYAAGIAAESGADARLQPTKRRVEDDRREDDSAPEERSE